MSESVITGITMGDAAGVGPELCLRLLAARKSRAASVVAVYGSSDLLRRVAVASGIPFDAPAVKADEWDGSVVSDNGFVIDCGNLDAGDVIPGKVQSACGTAAFEYIKRAVRDAQSGRIAGIVTAPINKEALALAGVPYPGHTEMLADLTGCRDFCMMMAAPEINVCLVTTHIALRNVPGAITPARIYKVIELAAAGVRTGGDRPRLTVCALNPHAGENGLFGDEEQQVIIPAIERARASGYDVTRPLPPDTAFTPDVRRKTDAYIVMYHDQGLIPFKMLAFDHGINVTLGLPIKRSSPDHGTAFDIAWQGEARADSMLAAFAYIADAGTK